MSGGKGGGGGKGKLGAMGEEGGKRRVLAVSFDFSFFFFPLLSLFSFFFSHPSYFFCFLSFLFFIISFQRQNKTTYTLSHHFTH